MADLLTLARAARQLSVPSNHSILIYGDPKTGKSRLAGTIAKIPQVRSVYYFDGENGSDTLFTMHRTGVLTDEQAAKIQLIKIHDAPDTPYFVETLTKVLLIKKAFKLCAAHGRVLELCAECKKLPDAAVTEFDITKLGHADWIIIDTLSQLAASAMEAATKGFDYTTRLSFDEYGFQGRVLSDVLQLIQSAPVNFCCIAHPCILKENTYTDQQMNAKGQLVNIQQSIGNTVRLYPSIGTKNFSLHVAKYFGTIIYTDKKLKKFIAGSSANWDSDVITGSRLDIAMEKEETPDLSVALMKAGVYTNTNTDTAAPTA